MATIVLVHGGWHGAWCWYKLAPLLERYGHRVVAPDLPGHGLDRTPAAELTLGAYVERVCAAVAAEPEPVILAGHSFGGVIITQVAEVLPERVAVLVYISAFLPADGQSLMTLAAADPDSLVTASSVLTPDQTAVTLQPDKLREIFYADCPEEDVAVAMRLLVPEAVAPLATPVATTPARFGRIPRAYIACRQDRALLPALQQQMAAALPCDPVLSLDTGHSPFLAAPDLLAAQLDSLASGAARRRGRR